MQVGSSGCLCRVDVGVKSVAGAKKFVPGKLLCAQPSIKHSIHPSRSESKPGHADKSRGRSSLLPGLPDDLTIACLIRVPLVEHHNLRLVCKRWHRLLAGNYFYALRKNLKLAEEWIYIVKREKDGRNSWDAFDPIYRLWRPLPPLPAEYSEATGFGCAVLSGCHLYLFGGNDPNQGSMRRVIFYSARTNKWHRAPDMLRRRHLFASCVVNNCLYVAGGESEGIHPTIRSAEVYDPSKNRWSFVANMSTTMLPYIGVVYDNKWFLKGLGPLRQVQSEAYDPKTNSWTQVFDGMVTGWRNPSACLDGKLYASDCKDGCKLRVYNDATGSWSSRLDSKVHLGSSPAVEAAALVPVQGKLCLVRNNMSISLVDVTGNGNDGHWEMIAAGKTRVKGFVASIWSNIAGRNRVKTRIVHCQVLQA